MRCPVDNSELRLSERQGIEIDYCPTCRGVWLDRGELDKILDRNDSYIEERPRYEDRPSYEDRPRYEDKPRYEDRSRPHYDDDDDYRRKKKKHKGFLGDLFEFGE